MKLQLVFKAEIFKHSNSADADVRTAFVTFQFILKVFRNWINKTDDEEFMKKQRKALEKVKRRERASEEADDHGTSPLNVFTPLMLHGR